jgi:hypothetical protein
VSNKVRPGVLGAGDEQPESGPALYLTSPGGAAIRDDAQPLRSKRYLATMVLQAEGWILSVNTPPSTHGPFLSPGAAFAWWGEHRHAIPGSTGTPWRRESWPPGIDEDWAEHDETPPAAP